MAYNTADSVAVNNANLNECVELVLMLARAAIGKSRVVDIDGAILHGSQSDYLALFLREENPRKFIPF